ncbi:carbohydrate ABC transporter permease [Paenibacillus oceani]|uniref:Carbohydrate ABC transporter permease n=1 Tax=Paenibacillus oceani TaxID=2772510 RepID=A0A927CD95_9BACL|nr:carbohydrate ABC transporter permease [Paenibacillus oceani]MBD2863695.1 carbohydrate ABC transporter permease [Paenibacillus oceani]
MTYTARNRLGKWIVYGLLLVMAVISLLPLYWIFITSFQLPSYQNEEMEQPVSYVESDPPKLYPFGVVEYFSQWQKKREAEQAGQEQQVQFHEEKMQEVVRSTFSSYVYLFKSTEIIRWLINTIVVAIIGALGCILFDTMAGYVLAKKQFPGRMAVFWIILATMMIPEQVTLVPTFMIVQNLQLYDTLWAVILPGLAGAFGVFLMRQFLVSTPNELLEASKIDGASEWKTFIHVVVPLAMPAMASLGIFTFVAQWNSFLWPIIVLNDVKWFTLTAGLKTLQDANLANFKLLMTGAAVGALPVIAMFLMLQKYFIQGLTLGGLKE